MLGLARHISPQQLISGANVKLWYSCCALTNYKHTKIIERKALTHTHMQTHIKTPTHTLSPKGSLHNDPCPGPFFFPPGRREHNILTLSKVIFTEYTFSNVPTLNARFYISSVSCHKLNFQKEVSSFMLYAQAFQDT